MIDPIEYVTWWIKRVDEEMSTRPETWAHHWTEVNISGGYTGWEIPIDDIYFRPKGLDQRLLQAAVHERLLVALEWTMNRAERDPADILDIAEAYRLAYMVSLKDPLVSAASKIRLNIVCQRLREQNSLREQAPQGFGVLIVHHPENCLKW